MGRGALALAVVFRTLATSLTGPVIGPLLDRYGPRMLLAIGAFLSGLAVMAKGGVQEYWQFVAVSILLGLVAGAGRGMLVPATTVARWFVRLRGRPIPLVTAWVSVGAPPPAR